MDRFIDVVQLSLASGRHERQTEMGSDLAGRFQRDTPLAADKMLEHRGGNIRRVRTIWLGTNPVNGVDIAKQPDRDSPGLPGINAGPNTG
jgi:hypothetical protein